jgi:hypothetical protein
MKTIGICIVGLILMALDTAIAAEPENLTQAQLLDRFEKTMFDLGKSFLVEYRETSHYRTIFGTGKDSFTDQAAFSEIEEIRYDGEHFYRHRISWPEPMTGSTEQDPDHRWDSWDGKFWLFYNRPCVKYRQAKPLTELVEYYDPDRVSGSGVKESSETSAEEIVANCIVNGGRERYDEVLRRASRIDLNPKLEEVNGSLCYPLHAVTPYGDFRIWLDSAKEYSLTQVIIRRSQGDTAYGLKQLPEGFKSLIRIRILRMEKIDGVWIPMEFHRQGEQRTPPAPSVGEPETNTRYEVKTSTIRVERNKKFNPGDFTLDIPDGTEVWNYVKLNQGVIYESEPKYLWKSGAGFVWNREGRRVAFDPAGLLLPVVKTVPPLRSLNLQIPPEEWKDRPILFCFVDPSDSACQDTIKRLEQKKADLDRRSIISAVIPPVPKAAGGLSVPTDNNTPLPSGFLHPKSEAKNRRAWGIERLPWLVLADMTHVVRAEGFDVSQIDQLLSELFPLP